MTRSINPVPQWTKGGEPIANGEMYFFDTNSNTPKTTFADASEKTANTHPVILDAEGRLPNCFFSGLAKQILTEPSPFTQGDGRGEQVFNRDPVGMEIAISAFDAFAGGSVYQINAIVTTSNGQFYKSLISGNTGFDPITDDGTHWQQIAFSDFYADGVTFGINDKAISTVDGLSYISGVTPNKGNEPSANLDKWALDQPALPYVSGRTYLTGEKAISIVDKREYESQSAQTGNEPSVSPVQWLPIDGITTKTVNTAPSDAETGVSRTPTLTTNAYAVTGSTAEFEWAQYQLSKDSFVTIDHDSGIVRDTPSYLVPIQLDAVTEYSMRVFHKGVRTDISTESDTTTFTTTLNLSESFDTTIFIGTGAALGINLTPNLTTGGIVFITNASLNSGMRICDAVRGPGVSYEIGVNSIELTEANGVTSFNAGGFSVGTDVNYNTLGDDIYTFVFKETSGVVDVVNYAGNGTNRTVAHSLADEVGFMLCRQETGANPSSSPFSVGWVRGMSGSQFHNLGINTSLGSISAIWNGTMPTSSVFSLGADERANGAARTYSMYLFAHKPAAGVFCGSYTGTGLAGLKIVTGFPVSTFLVGDGTTNRNWVIFDKKLGTSSHIQLDSNARSVVGGPVSFDSDGITLDGDLDSNASGDTFYFMAIADPDLF